MSTASTTEILDLLLADHRLIEEKLEKLVATRLSERESVFCELVQIVVSHEVAEELVVYPSIREDVPDGAARAEPRLKEQKETEEKLATMEKLDPISPAFSSGLVEMRSAVLAHAKAEEESIFPLLRLVEDGATRMEMGLRYQRAKDSAPTHPHPHAPDTPPGNKLVGPVAALFDKVRDAARSSL
jgi:hemerythrin superfamily protein